MYRAMARAALDRDVTGGRSRRFAPRRGMRFAAALSAVALMTGCATDSGSEAASASLDSRTTPAVDRADAVYGIRQIQGSLEPDIAQRQIPQAAIEDRLTVDQLKAFADRCRSGMPPPGLDCSGIKLRVERLFRNDDEVVRALTVLDRLGTSEETPADMEARLFIQRAIAQGALLPDPPPEPEEPDLPEAPDGTSLIDAIIATTGPGG